MPNERPKVGPADPETRRRLLHEKLNEPTRSTGVVTPPKPKPKKKRSALQEVRDALNPKIPRERTVEGKNESLSEAVDRGIKEADSN